MGEQINLLCLVHLGRYKSRLIGSGPLQKPRGCLGGMLTLEIDQCINLKACGVQKNSFIHTNICESYQDRQITFLVFCFSTCVSPGELNSVSRRTGVRASATRE